MNITFSANPRRFIRTKISKSTVSVYDTMYGSQSNRIVLSQKKTF